MHPVSLRLWLESRQDSLRISLATLLLVIQVLSSFQFQRTHFYLSYFFSHHPYQINFAHFIHPRCSHYHHNLLHLIFHYFHSISINCHHFLHCHCFYLLSKFGDFSSIPLKTYSFHFHTSSPKSFDCLFTKAHFSLTRFAFYFIDFYFIEWQLVLPFWN